jgi:hypothetical protein
MRSMIRLGVLALAALGAKNLWDKYGAQPRRADRARTDTRAPLSPSAGAGAPDAEVTGLAQRIGNTPGRRATDPNYSPMQKAQEVSAVFEADKERVSP